MAIIDTNVLLRYLTQDNAEQARRAFDYLTQLESTDKTAFLPEAVLVETVQVLSSKRLYAIDREVIRLRLSGVLGTRGVRLANKRTYLRALDLYVEYSRLSFVDALLIALAERDPDKTIVSFDEDFKGIPLVTWQQP